MRFWHRIWGSNIKAHREGQGMSRMAFANLCGVTEQTVSRWESGKLGVTDIHKIKIAEVLDVDVRALFPLERGPRL